MIRGVISTFRQCTTCYNRTQNQATVLAKIVPWNTTRHSTSAATEKSTRYSQLHNWVFKNLRILQRHLSEQCEFIVAQRVRRAHQIWVLYSQLYSDKTVKAMVSKLSRRLSIKQRPLGLLLGTASAVFSWDHDNISDEEMASCACDLENVDRLLGTNMFTGSPRFTTAVCQEEGQWEFVINREHLKVWRKPIENSLFEYKVFGTFYDVPARAFFRVQIDTEYRKHWDQLVIKLNVIDNQKEDNQGESQVIHWVTHYPYPMYSRDYVYVRRFMIDEQNKLMMTVSKSINHPAVPVDKNYVRVHRYRSQLCVRPHEHFDKVKEITPILIKEIAEIKLSLRSETRRKNGFDYVLTYFDDPQAAFPGPAYSWMTSSGVPDFVNKLHSATVSLINNQNLANPGNLISNQNFTDSDQNSVNSVQQRKRSRNRTDSWPPK